MAPMATHTSAQKALNNLLHYSLLGEYFTSPADLDDSDGENDDVRT